MKNLTTQLLSSLVVAGVLASTVTLLPTASAKGHCAKSQNAKGCAVSSTMSPEKCRIMQGWEHAVQLTPAQATKVATIRQAYQPEREQLKQHLHMAKETMRRLMEGSTTTAAEQAAVLSQARAVGAIKTQLDTQHIKEAFEIKAVLTPEQQQISNQYWHDMWERKEQMGYGRNGMMRNDEHANMNNGKSKKSWPLTFKQKTEVPPVEQTPVDAN